MKIITTLILFLISSTQSYDHSWNNTVWIYCGLEKWSITNETRVLTITAKKPCDNLRSTFLNNNGSMNMAEVDTGSSVLKGVYIRETSMKWLKHKNRLLFYYDNDTVARYNILTQDDSSMTIKREQYVFGK